MGKKQRIFIVILLVVVSLAISLVLYYTSTLKPLERNGQEKLVEIPSGYSSVKIGELLEKEEIIKSGFTFQVYVKLNDMGSNLKAGRYLLSSGSTVMEIVDIISSGQVVDESVTITFPEGWTLNQMADEIEKNQICSAEEFIQEASDVEKYKKEYAVLKDIGGDRTLEGYLFPDTYYFDKDDTVENVIRKMLDRFEEVFKGGYYQRAEDIGMTVDEVVILASIVEQETKYDEDRSKVAGVFYNRLEENMPLQSDVTVLYALGVKKERVLTKDLEVDSPYNTYINIGLPIGPIGSFGEESLKAALYPEDHDYLYFIAKPDGHCVFNRTLREHNEDVEKYLR